MTLWKDSLWHLTTVAGLTRVLEDGALLARSRLPDSVGSYARADLIVRRRALHVDGAPLTEYVPTYRHPHQPMFVRLVEQGRLRAAQVVAVAIDPAAVAPVYFDGNPASGGSRLRTEESLVDDDGLFDRWSWEAPDASSPARRATMEARQAEAAIRGSVPVSAMTAVVLGGGSSAAIASLVGTGIRVGVDHSLTQFHVGRDQWACKWT